LFRIGRDLAGQLFRQHGDYKMSRIILTASRIGASLASPPSDDDACLAKALSGGALDSGHLLRLDSGAVIKVDCDFGGRGRQGQCRREKEVGGSISISMGQVAWIESGASDPANPWTAADLALTCEQT
jgi:hypothetical protein